MLSLRHDITLNFYFFKTLVYSGKKVPKSRHLSGKNASKMGKNSGNFFARPCLNPDHDLVSNDLGVLIAEGLTIGARSN